MIELYENWLSVHTAVENEEVQWWCDEREREGLIEKGSGTEGVEMGREKVCRVWKCRGIYHSGLTV